MDHRRRGRMWRLISERAEHRGFSGWTGVVCELVREELAVDGAAIALRVSGRSQELVAATGAWPRELEELEYTVGDGPAVEAHITGEPVLVPDMATDAGRWPGFAEVAGEMGLAAVFAFPLQGSTFRLGTLDVYRRRHGALSLDDLAEAATLADAAATALLADAVGGPFDLAPWVREDTPGHYDDVNVATGMVAAKLRISIEDASLRLRAHAFSHDQPLLDVARAIVQRQWNVDVFGD